MTGFYYFFEQPDLVEKDNRLNTNLLREVGLMDSLYDSLLVGKGCMATGSEGPNRKSGKIVYPETPGKETPASKYIYNAEMQEWVEREGFWIGWEKANPPGPSDLERLKDFQMGLGALDDEDREWCIPVMTSKTGNVTLTMDFGWDKSGKFTRTVKKRHQTVWELAGQAFEYLQMLLVEQKDTTERFSDEWIASTAVAFVGINHRIGRHEAEALKSLGHPILDRRWSNGVLQIACDWWTWWDYLKKKRE